MVISRIIRNFAYETLKPRNANLKTKLLIEQNGRQTSPRF